MKKVFVGFGVFILVVIAVATIGGSFYMLDFSLAPDPNRRDTAFCYSELYEKYPETRQWIDSLNRIEALRDTLLTMPSGERHHALYIRNGGNKTALILHGWRDCSIDFLFLARIYEKELGYDVVLPDLHAHGYSDGDRIQMGWLDRIDALHWLTVFKTDTMAVHGVSMGAATAMMLSAEAMPEGIKDIRFIEDCGYTSVWDEFAGELKNQFGLPEFPLMYMTSLLCKISSGWSFGEASAINQVRKCSYPMLFIHGDSDSFVPTEMVYRLYDAKPSKKKLWVTRGTKHAESYKDYRAEYVKQVKDFLIE